MLRFALLSLVICTAATAAWADSATTDGRGEVRIAVANHETKPLERHWPAGTIFATKDGPRVVTLKETALSVAPGATGEAEIPAAALSAGNKLQPGQQAQPVEATEPKLAPLLKYLAGQNDVPRATSQCAVLALTEDIGFRDWLTFCGAPGSADVPLVEAIDALGILRMIEPAKTFRLGQDQELKMKALRHPGTRGKAGALYGLAIPGDAVPGAVPPDLGQLLHTKPGDNCPICRMRAQMQGSGSNGL
jgi:hypothetical protein